MVTRKIFPRPLNFSAPLTARLLRELKDLIRTVQYSMGAADDKNKPADTSFHDARCCCGCMKLNVAAYLIALIEFVFILYNVSF